MSSMDRKDLLPVVLLITLLFLWGPLSRILFPPPEMPAEPPERPSLPAAAIVAGEPDVPAAVAAAPAVEEPDDTATDAEPAIVAPRRPEERLTLANANAEIVLTTWGAGIRHVRLLDYRATLDPDSDPVILQFNDQAALAYSQTEGFPLSPDFTVVLRESDRVHFKAESPHGLVMIRELTMDPDNPYRFLVRDVFQNTGAEIITVANHAVQLGPLRPEAAAGPRSRIAGADLSVDALPSGGGQRVRHWSKKRFMSSEQIIPNLFYPDGYRGGGCSPFGRQLPAQLPRSVEQRVPFDTDWIAVKNKFFVQILEPQHGAAGYRFAVERAVPEHEHSGQPNTWSRVAQPELIAAALELEGFQLDPGETFERRYSYYAGPKEYSSLQSLGNHQESVMEFGRLRFFCRILLRGLNGLYALIPNYGIAVMLLTILIRILFWPVTRKSTESMKRMQELQPEMKALRERYKDNPQKVQQETMALYKKHKVNPVAGCLPMVIQIPVFFALFTVLRSAVELRFAPFLWVRDLSEPENLLAGMIPIIGSLNILPVLMTVTMVWQQHLTPSAGDPAQRKMMMFMPVMMLVFFYSMPSALVLYWTTNQCLMIVQLYWQRKQKAAGGGDRPAVAAAPTVALRPTPRAAAGKKRKR